MEAWDAVLYLIGPSIVTTVAVLVITKRFEMKMAREKAKIEEKETAKEKDKETVDFLKGEIEKLQEKLNISDKFSAELIEKVGELKEEKAEFETALKLLTNYLTK